MKAPLFLFSALLLFASCKKEGLKGSGAIVTEDRTGQNFYIVRVEGDATVEITEGAPRKVEVSGYENLVPRYEAFATDGQLVLRFEQDVQNVRNNNIKVRITAPYVSSAIANGSGRFLLQDLSSSEMALTVKGSGEITAKNCEWGRVVADVDGSGKIDARYIDAANCDALVVGSGTINLFSSWKLKARVIGSGSINYYGGPTETDFSISGSGRIQPR